MDAHLKAKWVAALRSGEFKQGVGEFEFGQRFCCLGVLCVVANKPRHTGVGDNWYFADAVLGSVEASTKLAHLNDNEGQSFAEIADYIEANL
jgi:hypothetical protein